MSQEFQFGQEKVNAVSAECCGKPRGCTMTHDGCVYLKYPWKRAMLFNDRTVRCQAMAQLEGQLVQCSLLHGHDGSCNI